MNAEYESATWRQYLRAINEITQNLEELPFWEVEIVRTFVVGLRRRPTRNGQDRWEQGESHVKS